MFTPNLVIGLAVMAAGLAFLQPRRALVSGFALFAAVLAVLGFQGIPVAPAAHVSAGGEHLTLFSVMRHASGRSVSSDFDGARLIGAMGQWTLDLRQATIPPGENAVVDVFAAMGKVTMILPDGWDVDGTALRVIGVVDDARSGLAHGGPGRAAPSRLVLRGVVMMGKVEIRS